MDGWDGTEDGVGTYESEAALRKLFAPFGKFVQATIRHRIDKKSKKNTSALSYCYTCSATAFVSACGRRFVTVCDRFLPCKACFRATQCFRADIRLGHVCTGWALITMADKESVDRAL